MNFSLIFRISKSTKPPIINCIATIKIKPKPPSAIHKFFWIAYVGLGFILLVALQLIISGLNDYGVLSINETFKQYF